jgi:hypothetical protein
VKKKNLYKAPQPGDTVHCWKDSKEYVAHHHMLYLGKDKDKIDKILVKNKEEGWKIIPLAALSEGSFRPLGRFNLVEEIFDKKKKPKKYTYRFWDKKEPIDISVKVYRSRWVIETKFEMPSWVDKECLNPQESLG